MAGRKSFRKDAMCSQSPLVSESNRQQGQKQGQEQEEALRALKGRDV